VEGLYTHWFLGELGNNWSDVCADELATYGKVLEVPQQEDFYRSRIQTSDTKVFVIISDAMRYEVAATMADQLQRETQSKVSGNKCPSDSNSQYILSRYFSLLRYGIRQNVP